MPLTTRRSTRPASPALRRRTAIVFAAIGLALVLGPRASTAQRSRSMPDSLTDREFWQFFTSNSEDGGSFPSENFVSNEQTYQHVIPTLQHTLTPGGVYLGVGPEQNFTYIANLKPRMAVIFDIRRQNAMAHLMYKALFELSATRAEFVSRLFSRPLRPGTLATASATALFAAVQAAPMSDSAFDANRRAVIEDLTVKHGFALTPEDIRSITHVLASFFEAGPNISYGYRSTGMGFMTSMYATYADIQSLTNAEGANMAFLGTEENYRWLRALHGKNLVIPVVGDFAGPKAIRGVGDYLKQHGGTVTAFYLSNVEQYLFRGLSDAEHFYKNVEALPVDSTSSFIRSVPPNDPFFGGPISMVGARPFVVSSNAYSVRVVDSAGASIIWTTTTDSTGRAVTTRTVDSTSGRRASPLEIFRSLRSRGDSIAQSRADSAQRVASGDSTYRPPIVPRGAMLPAFGSPGNIVVRGAGPLVSGIAPIGRSLDLFERGQLGTYAQVIAMTKTTGWK